MSQCKYKFLSQYWCVVTIVSILPRIQYLMFSYLLAISSLLYLLSDCRAGVWTEAEMAKFVYQEDPLPFQAMVSARRGCHSHSGFCMLCFFILFIFVFIFLSSSSFFKVSLASQEEIMYQLWIWIMTRTHTIPQPLYPTSIFANIKSNVENCKTNFKLISLRCSQQRSKRQACSSLQGLASGPGPCHQRRDLMILWRTPRTALNYPQTQWMTSTKQSKT